MQIQTVEKGPSAKQLVFQKIAFYTSFQSQNSFINKEGVQMNSRTQVKKFIIALAIVFSDALCFARCAPALTLNTQVVFVECRTRGVATLPNSKWLSMTSTTPSLFWPHWAILELFSNHNCWPCLQWSYLRWMHASSIRHLIRDIIILVWDWILSSSLSLSMCREIWWPQKGLKFEVRGSVMEWKSY